MEAIAPQAAVAVGPTEARINITWDRQNGDLPDPVAFDSSDADVRALVTEAVRTGSVPGVRGDDAANFTDFVVERFPPTETRPFNLIQIRPKVLFGI